LETRGYKGPKLAFKDCGRGPGAQRHRFVTLVKPGRAARSNGSSAPQPV